MERLQISLHHNIDQSTIVHSYFNPSFFLTGAVTSVLRVYLILGFTLVDSIT